MVESPIHDSTTDSDVTCTDSDSSPGATTSSDVAADICKRASSRAMSVRIEVKKGV